MCFGGHIIDFGRIVHMLLAKVHGRSHAFPFYKRHITSPQKEDGVVPNIFGVIEHQSLMSKCTVSIEPWAQRVTPISH